MPRAQAPVVSTTTGAKICVNCKWEYKACFLVSAESDTAPERLVAKGRYVWARVSEQVASYTSGLPHSQGIIVTPWGRLPSHRARL